jgi:hypothetical protein
VYGVPRQQALEDPIPSPSAAVGYKAARSHAQGHLLAHYSGRSKWESLFSSTGG